MSIKLSNRAPLLKADASVKLAIESSIYREKQWLKKSSTVVKCRELFEKLSETEHIPTVDNCPNVAMSTLIEVPKLKRAANKLIAEDYINYWNAVAKPLTVQGDFLRLLAKEKEHKAMELEQQEPKGSVKEENI